MKYIKKGLIFALVSIAVLLTSCGGEKEVGPKYRKPFEIPEISSMSDDDVRLIVRLCHFETEGESLAAKTAFCDTVVNRLENEFFPDTVAGVVFEPNAYKSVKTDEFYSELPDIEVKSDFLALYYASEKKIDITDGALFCRSVKDGDEYLEIVPNLVIGDLVFGNVK